MLIIVETHLYLMIVAFMFTNGNDPSKGYDNISKLLLIACSIFTYIQYSILAMQFMIALFTHVHVVVILPNGNTFCCALHEVPAHDFIIITS